MGSRAASLCVLLAAHALAGSALAQGTLGLANQQNAGSVRERRGETFTFVCPPTEAKGDNVYGTDTYTESSPVCPAAIHAGVLQPGQSGIVTLLIGKGAKSFRGSQRNGVATLKYGPWGYSYSFVKDENPGSIGWGTTWNGIPMAFTAPIAVRCPPDGKSTGVLWGSNPYPRDSSICLAAVHAGIIGIGAGGAIRVQRVPGAKDYPGSLRNGVESKRWGAYEDAFTVLPAAPPVPLMVAVPMLLPLNVNLPAAPPPQFAIPPRNISLSGFTAVGSATQPGPLNPRQFVLSGFTAVGAAASAGGLAPRTLQTTGWVAVGSAP
ncbi:MAG: LCCL domain-containing protein [Steroidobacteraceae bacterium]